MNQVRKKVLKLLEDCDECEVLKDHHLKLSDKPENGKDLNIGYNGHDFVGWYAPTEDGKVQVVLFIPEAEDGTNMYVEEMVEKSEDEVKRIVDKMVKQLEKHL